MPKLVHFEITADQTERAVKFYARVFGWDIQRDDSSGEDYWLVQPQEEEPYVTGGILPRAFPSDASILTYEVSSIDGFARRIVDAGGKVYEDAPSVLPGVGYVHYCEDSEGNTFGIIQYDEDAA